MLCNFFVSENYLGAKNKFLRQNGYGTCCIIGGHLGIFPETTENMEVIGYYCSVH